MSDERTRDERVRDSYFQLENRAGEFRRRALEAEAQRDAAMELLMRVNRHFIPSFMTSMGRRDEAFTTAKDVRAFLWAYKGEPQ